MVFAAVAFVGPVLKIVFAADTFDIRIQLVGAAEDTGLVGTNGIGLSAAGDFAFALANDNYGGVTCVIDIDAVNAGTRSGESQVGRVDLENLVTIQLPNANAQGALGELDLNRVVVKIRGAAPRANRGPPTVCRQ